MDSSLNTQLLKAARDGDSTQVQLLLQQTVDVNTPDAAGWTPLIHAAYHGHSAVIETLLKCKNGSLNVGHTVRANGATALHLGCAKGQLDVVRVFLESKCDINARDFDLATPLHAAVVHLLLSKQCKHGKCAVDWALHILTRHQSQAKADKETSNNDIITLNVPLTR